MGHCAEPVHAVGQQVNVRKVDDRAEAANCQKMMSILKSFPDPLSL